MKQVFNLLFSVSVTISFAACNNAAENTSGSSNSETSEADAIYYGGDIITMEGDSAIYPEAIAVKAGKIVFVGSKAEAEKMKTDSTVMNDLAGKTLVPGFIDAHSHFMMGLAMTAQANCSAPPVGPVTNAEDVVAALQKWKAKKNIPANEMIYGYGYDDNIMAGGKKLNRDHLDKGFPENPVVVIHVSGHGAVLNSLALKKFGYSNKTVTPAGGVIVRKPGTNEPYELLMETAYLPVYSNGPKLSLEQQMIQLKEAQEFYVAAGVTTAQEGAAHTSDINLLMKGAKANYLTIDLVAYPLILNAPQVVSEIPFSNFGSYSNRLKMGGIKITVDGSPQGKTAFFTTPYLTGGPSGEKNWKGEPGFSQDSINAWVKWVYGNNQQLIIHGNGDGAMDMIIKAHEYACNELKLPLDADRRTTVIHSQFVRKDQLEKYKLYKIIPSFFTEHTFFFGDTHITQRGMQQASFLSPLNTALKLGLPATNHTDFNVLPIDQMMVVWSAVNRTTRSGVVLGSEERVSPYKALQAITINAAHQYSEESSKGSFKEGKLADMVILDANPLKVDPMKIKDIKVSQTIKEGVTVYKN